MAKKNGNMQIIIVAVAIIGVAVALIGFHKSRSDKTQRAMWSGLSNLGWPASEYLTHVDLGNIGDDVRYTINNPSGVAGVRFNSARESGDPNWLDLQMKADGMHGQHGNEKSYTLEHTPYKNVITAPDPIFVKPIIISAPKVGSNHETVGGNFLNKPKYPGIIP
jgi:hypothetical protein